MRIPLFGKSKIDTEVDPVCRMDVDIKNPPGGEYEHEGEIYYFCGPGCRVSFSKDANAYLSGEKSIQM